jgi:DNA-binding transcriptional ArsR family regulator
MKSSAPLLAPILRSDTQGKLLAELMFHPDTDVTLTELAARVGVSAPTIMRDIDRLVEGGFVTDRRQGRSRFLRINPEHPMYRALGEIVLYGYGPAAVIPQILASVANIDKAFIYGSWAERYRGISGPNPADIDVLVIGAADRSDLFDAARQASTVVGREVNITLVSAARWGADDDGFIRTVKSRTLIPIHLGEVT